MDTTENTSKGNVRGITANRLAIPIIIIIVILHVLVIFLFFTISKESQELSMTMQKSAEYVADANGLLAGSSLMSETATNFVLVPIIESGEVNVTPLAAYANELKNDRRGPQVVERFSKYNVSEEDRAYIEEAADAASSMMESQLHALALINSIYHFDNIPALSSIPLPKLSGEEKAFSKERKETIARQILLGTDYALNKQTVSVDVNACVGNIKKENAGRNQATIATIGKLRHVLWSVTALLMLILALMFILIYQQILIPIKRMTRQMRADLPLDQVRGLREVRELAIAYNALLRRRDTLDSILRSAAVTDSLTNLPNRYAFQQYLVESNDEGYSLALLLFDVNYLKKTNDTLGHNAGDELLRNSADCIATCFKSAEESNCFRLGGDEFAAVIKNPAMDVIDQDIKMFILEQQRRQISISWGCVLASELNDPSVEELIDAADKRMYERKKAMHEDRRDN